ncbi:MAG: hypothetical protein ACREUW_08735 [Burkholderiales bacterium]
MQITLLLSGALWPAADGAAPSPVTPALARLLARGRTQQRTLEGAAQWLCEAFGVARQHDWPVAPYALAGDGIDPGAAYWLCADPVHVEVGRTGAMVTPAGALNITADEATTLCAALNAHFKPALACTAAQAGRWYAQVAPDFAAADATGRRAVETELQMLLHAHPVNTAREDRGAPTLNSIVFSGGGVRQPPTAQPFDIVYTDLPLARGLFGPTVCHALPATPNAITTPTGARVLVALDPLEGFPSWPDALEAADTGWIAWLWQALADGRCTEARLVLTGRTSALECKTVPGDRWRFWRRGAPLTQLLTETAT